MEVKFNFLSDLFGIKFLIEFIRLIPLYPRWVQAIFVMTLVLIVTSVILCFVYWQTSKDRMEIQLLEVSINNEFIEDAQIVRPYFPPEEILSYQTTKSRQEIQISPEMPYLSKIAESGPIVTLRYFPFRWQFPNLDLKLLNNSKDTIYITQAAFEIKESLLDPTPVLVIHESPRKFTEFKLVNEGWGEVLECSIRFNIAPPNTLPLFSGTYRHLVSVGNFLEDATVDLSEALSAEGVDSRSVDGVIYSFMGLSYIEGSDEIPIFKNGESVRVPTSALGPFRSGNALVYGEICYSGKTLDKNLDGHVLKFSTNISLFRFPGAPVPPTYQYKAMFDVEKRNYLVGIPISQSVESKEADRFNVSVGVAKSSRHFFRLRLVYNKDRSLISDKIALRIFVPRTHANRLVRS